MCRNQLIWRAEEWQEDFLLHESNMQLRWAATCGATFGSRATGCRPLPYPNLKIKTHWAQCALRVTFLGLDSLLYAVYTLSGNTHTGCHCRTHSRNPIRHVHRHLQTHSVRHITGKTAWNVTQWHRTRRLLCHISGSTTTVWTAIWFLRCCGWWSWSLTESRACFRANIPTYKRHVSFLLFLCFSLCFNVLSLHSFTADFPALFLTVSIN